MKGDIYAWGACRCGGAWNVIRDACGKTQNILCEKCSMPPEKWGVDARAFKNRRGCAGRITKDVRGEFIYSVHQAKAILSAIQVDWHDCGPERFDPSRHSTQGRETFKLSECAREWQLNMKDRGLRPITIEKAECNVRLHILPVLGDLDIRSIVEDDIERLQRELRNKGLSDNTVNSALRTLNTLLQRYCHRKHVLDHVPAFPEGWSSTAYVERREVTVPEQRSLIARLVMAYPKADRRRFLLLQKVYTAPLGLRPGEAHGLRRMDVLPDGRVKVCGAIDSVTGQYGPRKTKDCRTTPVALPDGLLAQLRALPVLPGAFLFTKQDGKPWNQNRVSQVFKTICTLETVTYYTMAKHSTVSRIVRDAVLEGVDRASRVAGITKKVADANYNLGK